MKHSPPASGKKQRAADEHPGRPANAKTNKTSTATTLEQSNERLEKEVADRTRLLSIMHDIAVLSNTARSAHEAFAAALRRICDYNHWVVGHAFEAAGAGSDALLPSNVWYVDDNAKVASTAMQRFQQVTAGTRFSPGQGLIGGVMASGEALWIDDITDFDDAGRDHSPQLGLNAAIAFPVKVNDEVVAALEFYSDQPIEREERFMEVIPQLGIQLGHVIEREWLNESLREMASELAQTAETERRALAEALHDHPVQLLNVMKLKLDILRDNSDDGAAASALEEIAALAKQTGQSLQSLSFELSPPILYDLGLMAALAWLVEDIQQHYGVTARFSAAVEQDGLSERMRFVVFRATRELLINVAKHAGTGHAELSVHTEPGQLVIVVRDAGKGFLPAALPRRGGSSFGLFSIQQQLKYFRAGFHLESQLGAGTTVTIKAPLEAV